MNEGALLGIRIMGSLDRLRQHKRECPFDCTNERMVDVWYEGWDMADDAICALGESEAKEAFEAKYGIEVN